jgi:hypothetical protein
MGSPTGGGIGTGSWDIEVGEVRRWGGFENCEGDVDRKGNCRDMRRLRKSVELGKKKGLLFWLRFALGG